MTETQLLQISWLIQSLPMRSTLVSLHGDELLLSALHLVLLAHPSPRHLVTLTSTDVHVYLQT